MDYAVRCADGFPTFPRRPAEAATTYTCMAAFLYWWRIQFVMGTSRHSSAVCLAGSEGGLPHHATPTDLLGPCGALDALIVPKHSGIKPFSASSRTRLCIFAYKAGVGIAPTICELLIRCSTIELAICRDVRVQWLHDLLGHAMPHASCASLAGLHGTARLQAQRPAKPFGISLTQSCHLMFCPPALACKARTDGLPLSLHCRCLA